MKPWSFAGLIFLCGIAVDPAMPLRAAPDYRAAAAVRSAPLVFEPNRGQADHLAKFLASTGDYQLALMPRKIVLMPATVAQAAVTMNLVGSNGGAEISGIDELASKTNYLTDPDPRKWKTRIPNFARVRYLSIYPGIDLIFYGNQRQLEYDLVLAPGAKATAVRLRFDGAKVEIDQSGDLILHTAAGDFHQRKPVLYQEVDGVRKPISGSYELADGDVVFRVAEYDPTRKLVIDPIIVYGGSTATAWDATQIHVALDGSANVYLDTSLDVVHRPNLIQKFTISPSGAATPVFSTYFGIPDSGGNYSASVTGMAVDAAGQVYLTGTTGNGGLPIVNGYDAFGADGYLAKLSADGTQVAYSSYISGVQPTAITVDGGGNAFVSASAVTCCNGGSFQTKNALQPTLAGPADAAAVKVNTNQTGVASLVYATFLGGNDYEQGNAIAIDSAGNAYITGSTNSMDFPVRNALQSFRGASPREGSGVTLSLPGDAFVTKLDPSGALLYSTYLGGSGDDAATGIAVDSNSNIYVTGPTVSQDFPIQNGFQNSFQSTALNNGMASFIAKISADGATLLYSSFLDSGQGNLPASAIVVDPIGGVYVTGTTTSRDFPLVNPIHPVGLVKSSDGGQNWAVAGSGLPFSVLSLALDPQLPTTMYAGTEKGVFKSGDSGTTWTSMGLTTATVVALALDTTVSPSGVYAATSGGVLKSSDGGSTWVPKNSGLASLNIENLVVTSGGIALVYTPAGVYRSTNGGTSWTLSLADVFGPIAFELEGEPPLRPALALDPNSPTTIYTTGGAFLVYKSSDGGASWVRLNRQWTDVAWGLFVSPSSSSTIFVNIRDENDDGIVAKSTDGGLTWTDSRSVGEFGAFRIVADPRTPATMYIPTIFGSIKSTDAGVTWAPLSPVRFRDLVVDPITSTLYAGVLLNRSSSSFVAKVDSTKVGASSLVYSGYYGALGYTNGDSIAVDSAGNAFVAGGTLLPVVNSSGGFGSTTSLNLTNFLVEIGGDVVTSPSHPSVQAGAVGVTFNSVTAAGTTSVSAIDPGTAGQVAGGFAISNIAAYDIATTASVSGPIVSCFVVNSVNDAATFANLRILHSELVGSVYQPVDRTILAPGSPAPNFATRTLCAQTTSLSPFYLELAGNRLAPLFDQTKAHKSGSTLPVKVSLLSATGANLSSASTALTVRNIRLLGSSTLASTADSGNANPDLQFRYDSGGYIYNLSLKNYAPGRYGMSVFVGNDRTFFYTVEFQVK